ncbi:MAG: hypothetical protein F6K24_03515 [Okeania sp. SIO2D1]|nr:hypothetical protein [Okeania sp. SIO2D1]
MGRWRDGGMGRWGVWKKLKNIYSHYYQKIRSKASPWLRRELPLYKRMKKRSFAEQSVRMGWRGLLAISNRPRENQVQYFNPNTFLGHATQTGRG